MSSSNLDEKTVRDFGREWEHFDQSSLSEAEIRDLFDRYFGIFPWDALPPNAQGFDLGCGSGRWARLVSDRVGTLHCIDASPIAVDVAREKLKDKANCVLHHASVDSIPLAESSMDFGYSLGVLHHVPDVAAGLRACVSKLKPGAPFLLYLYYAMDNRPLWFRGLWRCTDIARRGISVMPHPAKVAITTIIAATTYFPLAKVARAVEKTGRNPSKIPLSFYRSSSFYTMRTDALDRFGTRLERRFSKNEISALMTQSGLDRVSFSEREPFWCGIGFRR